MNISDAIKHAMKEKNVSQTQMAKILDVGAGNYVSARLSKKNWTFDNAIKYLDILGYEIIIRPVSRGKRSEGEIKIDSSKE